MLISGFSFFVLLNEGAFLEKCLKFETRRIPYQKRPQKRTTQFHTEALKGFGPGVFISF